VAIIYGVKLCAMNMGQVSAALRISLGLIYAAIPVGCSLFLLFTVEAIFSTPPPPSGEVLL
jgi:TRAP-type C4-dicarboxylate transport system permease small subunit